MGSNWVLNIDISGKPVGLVTWHRAISLIYEDRATLVDVIDGEFWSSPSLSIPKPRIIQTNGYIKVRPIKNEHVVKRVLFHRDDYKCQYCGISLTRSTATIDHVIPRSQFISEGKPASAANTYLNCVTACARCNTKKGNRLPYECGMKILSEPSLPSVVHVMWAGKVNCPVQAEYISAYFKVDKNLLSTKSHKK